MGIPLHEIAAADASAKLALIAIEAPLVLRQAQHDNILLRQHIAPEAAE